MVMDVGISSGDTAQRSGHASTSYLGFDVDVSLNQSTSSLIPHPDLLGGIDGVCADNIAENFWVEGEVSSTHPRRPTAATG
jgi:hypothetical protein